MLNAGELHAYLRGIGIELMANSDNVLRAGCTNKHIDVQELLNIADFSPVRPEVFEPEDGDFLSGPFPEFRLLVQTNSESQTLDLAAIPGPRILLSLQGELTLKLNQAEGQSVLETVGGFTRSLTLRPGQAVFLCPFESELHISGSGKWALAAANSSPAKKG